MTWQKSDLPRWFRVANTVLEQGRRIGLNTNSSTLDELCAEARRVTNLSDFGARDFETPIQLLLESVAETDQLTWLGAKLTRQGVLRALINRLHVERARSAAGSTRPIAPPIFILGLPRTGTTLLQRMLASIEGARSPKLFELYRPIADRADDDRVEQCARDMALFYAAAPHVRLIHDVEATSPDECHFILENSGIFPASPPAERYQRWLATADVSFAYREHRSLLQLWQRDEQPTWVLKDPSHVLFLRALIEAYPDARIVECHRALDACVSSLCSLIHGVRLPIVRESDPRAVGREALDHCERTLRASLEARSWLPAEQRLDVEYEALTSDPVSVVRAINERFAMGWGEAHFADARRYAAEHPKHRHGAHKHALSDFGLDDETLRRRLEPFERRSTS
ncbi:MAG: sulfotransferase [Polyangiales bacterium]